MSCHDCPPTSPAVPPRAGALGAVEAPGRVASVVLVGNPNVGKSTLFNRLTGARQRVVNAPGTTVEVAVGRWAGAGVDLVDLPGTYSLFARSPDEQVAADRLLGRAGQEPPDLAVVVLDATAPSRSLYLLAQVAEAGRPVVVAVTLDDVARARGDALDATALARELGVPVVVTDPRSGAGSAALAGAVVGALADPPYVRGFPPQPAQPAGRASGGPAPDVGPRIDDLIAHADELFGWVARTVAAAGVAGAPAGSSGAAAAAGAGPRRSASDRIDAVLLHPWVGGPVFLAVMWALFQLVTAVAAPVMAVASDLVAGPVSAGVRGLLGLVGAAGGWVEGLVVDGVLAGVGTVLSFAPLMAIVFLAVAVLEDSGYLARAAFVADRAMRAIGLDGRALLPLVVGFGCNVPALTALRTLPSARQRLLVGLLVPYTSCSARLPVYILLASAFFPAHAGTVIFAMYVTSLALIVLGGLVARRTAFRDLRPEPLVLVLPAYQRPRLGALLRSAWARVWAFVASAGRVIVVTLTVLWALTAIPVTGEHRVADVPIEDSAYGAVANGIAPVFAPAGFDTWHASAALLAGFVAKEVVVGSFAQSLAIEADASGDVPDERIAERLRVTFEDASGGHGAAAALAFMAFVLAYTPCLATVAEQRRLFGWRWTAGAMGVQLVVAWVLAAAVFQVGRLL